MAGVGDVTGDGLDDVLVGASDEYQYESTSYSNGYVALFPGHAERGLGQATEFEHDSSWTAYGQLVSAAGDVDGDGRRHLLVGAPGDRELFFLETDGTRQELGASDVGAGSSDWNDRLGDSLAHLGDVNGDGFDDLGVGAYGSGHVYVLCGRRAVEDADGDGYASEVPVWAPCDAAELPVGDCDDADPAVHEDCSEQDEDAPQDDPGTDPDDPGDDSQGDDGLPDLDRQEYELPELDDPSGCATAPLGGGLFLVLSGLLVRRRR